MRVYSVDPGDPFLATLAARLLDGTLWPGGKRPDHPLSLAEATVYLPTRRAARVLAEELLKRAGGPTALPRIEALGESEEEAAETGVAIMGLLEARVALAALVKAFAASLNKGLPDDRRVLIPASGADAVRLADDLITLMDQVETQEADWADLPGLVERADLAGHWEITTRFLTIATEMWPAYLADTAKITAATARRLEAERAAAAAGRAKGPIIVAGSTGSIPATRRLIRAIAESPMGAVVLPGFDRAADAAAWDALAEAEDGPGHPQYGLKQLVDTLGLAPADVARLAPPERTAPPAPAAAWSDLPLFAAAREPLVMADEEADARRAVLAAALRPAAETHRWLADRAAADLPRALEAVTLVDADDERAEAAAVAIAMREAVDKGERIALVTPHRPLARRVSHMLRRWEIAVDDSAGDALAATEAGVLARLVAAVAAGGGAAEWLALVKHPLCALAPDRAAVRAMEKVFRGPRIAPADIAVVMEEAGEPAATLSRAVTEALAPLLALASRRATIADLARAHAAAVSATIGETDDRPDLAALAAAFSELASTAPTEIEGGDWPATFDVLISGIVVRGPHEDAAVRILGPLEARLQQFDHAILGGLNEGVWPAAPDAGPWMSRGMMLAFGIDLPERKIGLAAHDAFIAAHAARITLTRARKAAGEPTVASRWWQRLLAFAGPEADGPKKRGARLLALAEALETRPSVPPAPRPEPKPPLAARPTRIAVTDVARLVRDPYAIYAKRILKLRPLDPLEAEPDGADRGNLVHDVLDDFIRGRHYLDPDAEERFNTLAAACLRALRHFPDARALWGARLAHIAPEIVATERERAGAWEPVVTEGKAETEEGGSTLYGRIDRIDRRTDGAIEVIDYKTGQAPSAPQVSSLLEPQLPLEALLVRLGAIPEIPADAPIDALSYVRVASGRVALDWRQVAVAGGARRIGDTEKLVSDVHREFLALMESYRDPAKGYLSRARVAFENELTGDYDHLSRAAEWGRTEE